MALDSRLWWRCITLPTQSELDMKYLHKVALSLLCLLLPLTLTKNAT